MRQLPYLLRRTLFASFDDGLFTIAKGAAYSALLSFFPILATVATVLLHARADFMRRNMLSFLSQILPPGTQEVVLQQFRGKRPNTLLIVAVVLLSAFLGGIERDQEPGLTASMPHTGCRAIARLWRTQWWELALALLEIVPLVGASSLIIFGGAVERGVLRMIQVDPILNPFSAWWQFFFRLIRYGIAFAATASLTAILYFYGPYRKQRWRGVWPRGYSGDGALVDRNPGVRLVCGQRGAVQRALWECGDRNCAADLDVRAGGDCSVRLRIQCGV